MKILNGLLILLAALGLVLFVPGAAGWKPFIVMSGSMEPAVPVGSIVYTDTHRRTPEIGDIITYRLSGEQITHRVIRKDGGAWITKGDSNEGEDGAAVLPDQIVGTVSLLIPGLGYAVTFIRRKASAAGIMTLLALSLVLDRLSEKKQKDFERKEKGGMPGDGYED